MKGGPLSRGEGDVVLAWSAPNDAGFDFETFGASRRQPVDFDGLKLVAFHPDGADRKG